MPSVPFEVETVHQGAHGIAIVRASGIVRLEEEALVLEFSGRIAPIGEYTSLTIREEGEQDTASAAPSAVRTVRIPLPAIAALRSSGGLLFAPRLHIEVNRVAALAGVPWADGARCVLRLRRADRSRLRELALDVRLRLADHELQRLGASDVARDPGS